MTKYIAVALALIAAPAAAEVKSASASGFEIENKRVVPVRPADAYAALGWIGAWWSSSHTYSGKAENLSLSTKAGGCFCERLDGGGSVEHMRVVQARPGEMLRLQGGLGPLQAEAATGTLTFALKAVPGGTEIIQTYVVGGFIRAGGDKLAGPVDKVLAEQLAGLDRMLRAKKGAPPDKRVEPQRFGNPRQAARASALRWP